MVLLAKWEAQICARLRPDAVLARERAVGWAKAAEPLAIRWRIRAAVPTRFACLPGGLPIRRGRPQELRQIVLVRHRQWFYWRNGMRKFAPGADLMPSSPANVP
jgi:hypothetical protein